MARTCQRFVTYTLDLRLRMAAQIWLATYPSRRSATRHSRCRPCRPSSSSSPSSAPCRLRRSGRVSPPRSWPVPEPGSGTSSVPDRSPSRCSRRPPSAPSPSPLLSAATPVKVSSFSVVFCFLLQKYNFFSDCQSPFPLFLLFPS